MSTIKLEIEVNAGNARAVAQFLEAIAGVERVKEPAKMEVVDAEEVKASATAKTPTPRSSRAKPKSQPVEEEADYDEFEMEDEEDGVLGKEDDEDITADDLRAKQAEKVVKNREAIKAQLKKLGATGIKDLGPEYFQKYFDFLAKLK